MNSHAHLCPLTSACIYTQMSTHTWSAGSWTPGPLPSHSSAAAALYCPLPTTGLFPSYTHTFTAFLESAGTGTCILIAYMLWTHAPALALPLHLTVF